MRSMLAALGFLDEDPRAYIIVSHDRYFLDRVASEIWEIERDRLYTYAPAAKAAYSSYLEQRTLRLEAEQREYDAWAAQETRGREVIAELRTHGSHNYSHVRSREKALAKLGRMEAPPPQVRSISVALRAARPMGTGYAFELKGLAKAFARPVFSGVTFEVVRGDRIAIVGPNGSGKSTLLALLAERLEADAGTIRRGTGLTLAYFSQASADDLGTEGTAADAVLAAGDCTNEEARSLLGAMGLGGDEADKCVDQFPGGERRRIMLARLMARHADCLLLDEPTNDLDLASTEALEGVLAAYGGTVVLVSHDRYLLKNVCTRLVMLKDGSASVLDGGYDSYEALVHAPPETKGPEGRGRPRNEEKAARLARERLQREVERLERDVAKFDGRRAEIEQAFTDPQLYGDPAKMRELHAELELVKGRALKAVRAWEAALEALEALEATPI